MSTATNKAESTSHNASSWANSATDSIKELVALQVRTAQAAVDKSVGFGQVVTDFYQNQLNESIKLSQEYTKLGLGLTENLRKAAVEVTDRALRSIHI